MKQIAEQPVPQGKYFPATRCGNLIYTSGMTPRKAGKLLYSGKIRTIDQIDIHRDAVCLAAQNALNASRACLEDGERLIKIIQLTVFLNTEEGFTAHSKLADYASEFFIEKLGSESIGSRVAIGVASLPSDAPVEICFVGQAANSNL